MQGSGLPGLRLGRLRENGGNDLYVKVRPPAVELFDSTQIAAAVDGPGQMIDQMIGMTLFISGQPFGHGIVL